MKRFLLPIGLAAVAAAAVAALHRGAHAGSPPGLDRVSNRGVAIALSRIPEAERGVLDAARVTGNLRLLGSQGPISYYTATRDDGTLCFVTGARDHGNSPRFASSDCYPKGAAFPSAQQPLVDDSAFTQDASGVTHALLLTGFAADAVARVGLVDASDVLHSVAVVGNLYTLTDVPEAPVRTLVALDGAGKVIWSHSVG